MESFSIAFFQKNQHLTLSINSIMEMILHNEKHMKEKHFLKRDLC